MTIEIRPATAADAAAIADLHQRSWRSAYRGLLPDSYLDGPAGDQLAAHWSGAFAKDEPCRMMILIAMAPDGIAGFVAAWPKGPDRALIDNLHVAPGLRGGGLGRRLMGRAAAELRRLGFRSAFLEVIEGNHDARGFYRRLGGVEGAPFVEPIGGHPTRVIPVAWDDLAVLEAAGGP
ncbi:GNAT family N-acetyltransferase [Inquilinus sp. Marseille-Q2685]|uniref:GNAT family N-acetyltransferase n=1 Tax=Inquilinus sp. Marseille-Q2685 TaxID=2866581 RepID=UPI001CE3BC0C|nr:GNAT family N-acetyltransferase [Inquilinus sp. Marseille-Q2685]